jgi:uridine kinase
MEPGSQEMETTADVPETIDVEVDGRDALKVPVGTSSAKVLELAGIMSDYPVIAARFNNRVRGLDAPLGAGGRLVPIALDTPDGMSVYRRSLAFVLIRAVRETLPGATLYVQHSLSKGYYCEISMGRPLTPQDLAELEARMRMIVEADEPFVRETVPLDEALRTYEQAGQADKVAVLKYRKEPEISIYRLGPFVDHFYGCLAPSTGYVKTFEIRDYPPGFILRFPTSDHPDRLPAFVEQKKLAEIYREYVRWGQIMGVTNVGDLNGVIERGRASDIIKIAEALHEKRIAQLADLIASKLTRPRLVLISGPSSSGKTTFSKRLAIQMRVNALRNISVSTDDYFLDREATPRDENGHYDFETPVAIDIDLLNRQLLDLLAGKEVETPKFSFQEGRRVGSRKIQLAADETLILEGIHALNPILTPSVPSILKFKIYASALSQLKIDHHNRVPTTDMRKLRRIVRDNLYRGYSALDTLRRWPSISRGEDSYVFPFQEEADAMFSTVLIYEPCVLRSYAERLLTEITDDIYEYAEARRLLRFLSYFVEIPAEEVPPNSILREFIGGSAFDY